MTTTPKLSTLTVGQLLDDLCQLTRCQSNGATTNVVEIRLTTRGLEVETTPDEELTDKVEKLERDLEQAEKDWQIIEKEARELEEERDGLLEDHRTLELKVKELEKEVASLKSPRTI